MSTGGTASSVDLAALSPLEQARLVTTPDEALTGRVALVVGAGAGPDGVTNGQAAAVRYARSGAVVAAVDRSAEAVERTRALITDLGGVCAAYVCDATDAGEVSALVDRVIGEHGRIDVLHNNVGATVLGGTVDLDPADWGRGFALNVDTAYLTLKYVLPHMIAAGRGAVVNVSSVAALRDVGYPYPAYMASKAALNQLTVSVALTHAAQGIRANTVAPGFMDTPLVRAQLASQAESVDDLLAARHAASPTGRMGTCWDVANAAAFLAGDGAAYVNGVCLPVDGGLTQRCV